jgi:hypothetical protein
MLPGLLLGAGSLVATSLATGLPALAGALFGFGAAFGAINVAANAQGLALERLSGRSILSSFHAAFSAGGLVGAALAALAAGAGLAPRIHFAVLATVLALIGVGAVRFLLPPEADDKAKSRTLARPPRAIVVLGAAAFCTMLAEGAAVDWSAVYLSHSFGAAAGIAALAYTAFSLAMTASRTIGDRLNRRLGPVTLARSGAVAATLGLGLALAIGSVPVAIAGFAAMGAGLGVVVPVLFRAAASTATLPVATRQRSRPGRTTSAWPTRKRPSKKRPVICSICGCRSAAAANPAGRALHRSPPRAWIQASTRSRRILCIGRQQRQFVYHPSAGWSFL